MISSIIKLSPQQRKFFSISLIIIACVVFVVVGVFVYKYHLEKAIEQAKIYTQNQEFAEALKILKPFQFFEQYFSNKDYVITLLLILSSRNWMSFSATKDDDFKLMDQYLTMIDKQPEAYQTKQLTAYDLKVIANSYSIIGNYEKAIEYYNKTLAKDAAAFPDTLSDIAYCYEALGDYNKAQEYYVKSFQSNPDDIKVKYVYLTKVLDFSSSLDREKAKTLIAEMLKDESVVSALYRDRLYVLLGNICEQELIEPTTCLNDYYLTALKINPRSTAVLNALARFYLENLVKINDFLYPQIINLEEKATTESLTPFAYLEESLNIDSSRAYPYFLQGVMFEVLGDYPASANSFNLALKYLDKDNNLWGKNKLYFKSRIYINLAILNLKQNQKTEASNNIELAIQADSSIKDSFKKIFYQLKEDPTAQAINQLLSQAK